MVPPSDPVAPFLPTVARARDEGLALPPGAPADERRVAALVVLASIVRREGWTEVVDLSPAAAAQLEPGDPPRPLSFEPRAYRRLVEDLGLAPCTGCAGASGRARCPRCGGRARPYACSCRAGTVRCPSCMGAGRVRRVRIRHLQDRPLEMRELYAPPEMTFVPSLFSFESALERRLGAAAPPEPLRCHDLRPRAMSTAYRGGSDRTVEPDFHGHRFAGTIERAVSGLTALAAGGRLVAQAVRAYAWPLLWLRYGPDEPARDVVVYPDLTGALRIFAGVEGAATANHAQERTRGARVPGVTR
ncbi:hypothetical protein [Sorangium cellulosum]|uniref:Uncharacterized protein n=1 Tax=Sorangium cellulosum So0157-2 TaxID=1254432 RepID=S4XZU0_SORCE|nr:hypothetical protein [Sorangium cellulosum]AGP38752.1 hypothetical protein SCE1572_32265 [Sorangium cellulosum So0157-2]